ncbi:lipopolysaccharide biosynthesis protein [Citricoccus nitrophenolicus]|uniref:lipopolysaccharide biosynthesis protein n=1 Tax=Citricoccus nitrophenolicus TaxID=863575 RepID=UPI0031E50432
MSGLTGEAASSVIWSMTEKWVLRITGLVTMAILARFLLPEDFGQVAIALSMVALVQTLADAGFSTYLQQSEEAGRRTTSTAFWFTAGAGAVLTGMLIAAAPLAAAVLSAPDISPVIRAMAPAALLVALGAVPVALLRRQLRFRALAVQTAVAGGAGQLIAIVLAIGGTGVWALVAQTLVVQFLSTLLAWTAARWLPGRTFSRQQLGQMLRFGVKVIGVEFVSLGRLWAEQALIISVLGTAGLGFYTIAQRLVMIAQDLTTSALVPVSVTVFARVRGSMTRLRSGYLRAQTISHVLVVPVMLVLAVGSPWAIPLVFGGQWEPSILPAQILGVAALFTLGALDHGLFYSLGEPGRWLVLAVVVEAGTLLSTALTAPFGLTAVAWGYLAVAVLTTMARWVMVGRQLQAPWWTVATPLARCALPAAVAGGTAHLVSRWTADLHDAVALTCIGLCILVVYVPLARWLLPDTWEEARGLLAERLRTAGSEVRTGRRSRAS